MAAPRDVLISGAGIAGPILAYWLSRYGFRVTVVERADELRTGGHPVDLWGAAVEIVERMGVLREIEAERTRNDKGLMLADGVTPVEIDLRRLFVEIADRHVEIMRGRLVSLLYQCSRDEVEYLFGDTITALEERDDGVKVSFARSEPREFAAVIGADGQHSTVRRLAFGEEAGFAHYLGGYICGYTIPNYLKLDGTVARYAAPDRTIGILPIRQSDEIGVAFMFLKDEPLDIDYDDIESQKTFLREFYAGAGWETQRLLSHLDDARYFYFDSFSQIRMDSWCRGRIGLVGDAGYGPAPAVGGGTALAAVGAYVLAGELAEAGANIMQGLKNYEASIRTAALRSREVGPAIVTTLIPRSRLRIRAEMLLAPLILKLPPALQRFIPLLPRAAREAMRIVAGTPLKDYRKGLIA